MSYGNLIDQNLSLAYNQLKDLAQEVGFLSREMSDFNFATASSTLTEQPEKKIKAVILEESKKKNVRKRQLMFKSKDLPVLSEYDRVNIDAETWSVGLVVHQRRYITLLDVYKEE